jgi:putative sterol carrier protein
MIGMTVHDVFSRLAAARFVPELRGIDATYGFDINGAGRWRVIIHDGSVQVEEGAGEADGTLICDAADFIELVDGRRKAVTAMMQGRLAYRGPIEHLVNQTILLELGRTRAEQAARSKADQAVRP